MSVLRDIFRKRGRSMLTVFGVAIGVFTLVVAGAIAEKSRLQVEAIEQYRSGAVTVAEAGAAVSAFTYDTGARPLPRGAVDELRALPGVKEVVPQVVLQLDPNGVPVGTPATIVGGFGTDRLKRLTTLAEGRYAADSERGVTTVGADLVERLHAKVGDTIALRGREFEVAGIMNRTFVSAIDQAAMISIGDARGLFVASLPDAYRARVATDSVVLNATVITAEGTNPNQLATTISRDVPGVAAVGPSELAKESERVVELLDALVIGIGSVALLGGALSVVNTMILAATERTREIGIKRALGASGSRIVRDVLIEAAVIGAMGGVLGATCGVIAATVIGRYTAAGTGMGLFAVTPRLLIASVLFAIALGVLGGLYPARYAARLDPVDALAHK